MPSKTGYEGLYFLMNQISRKLVIYSSRLVDGGIERLPVEIVEGRFSEPMQVMYALIQEKSEPVRWAEWVQW